ncbi:MAG: hypothetical protein QM599_10785 [Pseudoxanthomonas sp.]
MLLVNNPGDWGHVAAWRIGYAGWMTLRFGPYLPSLAFAMSYVLPWWCIVHAMDKRGWHLKI